MPEDPPVVGENSEGDLAALAVEVAGPEGRVRGGLQRNGRSRNATMAGFCVVVLPPGGIICPEALE